MKVRPTSDKLKAAIFNVLFSISGITDFDNKIVLDVFAGSGALGIEALSTRLLEKLNKGTTAIQNLEIMKHCEALNISNISNLILCFL